MGTSPMGCRVGSVLQKAFLLHFHFSAQSTETFCEIFQFALSSSVANKTALNLDLGSKIAYDATKIDLFKLSLKKTHTLSYKAEENTTSTAPFKPSSLDSKCNIWKKLIRWQLFSIKMQIYTAVSVETPSIIVMINTHCANVTNSQCRK